MASKEIFRRLFLSKDDVSVGNPSLELNTKTKLAKFPTYPQIDFLNSVIVDMQRKNDELKTKLELYESAGILDESVEFIFNGVSAR